MSTVPSSIAKAAETRPFGDGRILRTQKDVVRDVMLSASECGSWLTLDEIKNLTRFGEASISAQLRHLRADGYPLRKQVRETSGFDSVGTHAVTYEYLLEKK